MIKEIDCSYTDEVVCPYCGHKDSESYEYFQRSSDSVTISCNECDKVFRAHQEVSVDYSTEKLPCMNGEGEHKWIEWWETGVEDIERRYCRDCEKVETRKKGAAE
jgi:hypothetical protein